MRKCLFGLALLVMMTADVFAAQPAITVNAPLGGEAYWEGVDQIIAVKSRIKLVKVELSRDGGLTYQLLGTINNRAKDRNQRGRFTWTVGGDASTNCRLRFSGDLTRKKHITTVSNRFVIMNKEFLQGDTGFQGLQGPIGLTGATGPQGLTGSTGTQGLKGDKGDVGNTGPQGAKGDAGDIGSMGPQGPQGLQGNQGPVGPAGLQGDAGPQGDLGAVGPQGPQGDQGPAGPQGPQGIAGDVGAVGPQGPQGDQGPAGPVGPQGPQGDQGPQGEQGPAGPTGPQGPQGSQGPIGPNGSPTVSYINTASTANAIFDSSKHNGTLVIQDAHIRGPNNVNGRSQIFISFSTTSSTAGVVSLSCSNLVDGAVTVNISTQNYAIKTTDSIDYQVVNAQ